MRYLGGFVGIGPLNPAFVACHAHAVAIDTGMQVGMVSSLIVGLQTAFKLLRDTAPDNTKHGFQVAW